MYSKFKLFLFLIISIVTSCKTDHNEISFRFDPNDLESVLKFNTTSTFEIIPNKEIETKIEKEKGNENNYNRYDYIKTTTDGWLYNVRDGKITVKAEIKNDELHGRYWTFFDSGKVRSMGTYENGKKNNLWIQFYPNGEQANYGKWDHGNEVGKWNYYDRKGNPLEEREFTNINYYKFVRWDTLGNSVLQGRYLNNLKEGEWEAFSEEGELISQSNYSNGKLNGIYKNWSPDGKYTVANFKNNKMHGSAKTYSKKMELIKHIEFENDSIIKTYIK